VETASGIDAVTMPYIGLAITFFVIAAVFFLIPMPDFKNPEKADAGVRAFKHPHFVWGWLGIFFYVGSEVTVGSILINYLGDDSIMGLAENEADKYLSFYWGGLMIGRLMGAVSLSEIGDRKKFPLMTLAALFSFGIIFLNATFKEHFTKGEFLSMSSVAPFLLIVLIGFVFFALGRSRPGRMVGLFSTVAIGLTDVGDHRDRPLQFDHVVEYFHTLHPGIGSGHLSRQLPSRDDDRGWRGDARHPGRSHGRLRGAAIAQHRAFRLSLSDVLRLCGIEDGETTRSNRECSRLMRNR